MRNKILTIFLFIATMLLTSCGTYAQVSVSTAIESDAHRPITYSHVFKTYPVVYFGGIPYCRFYMHNVWHYRLIPLEQRHLITPLLSPMRFPSHHASWPYHIHGHHTHLPHYGPSSSRHYHPKMPDRHPTTVLHRRYGRR